MKVFKRVLSMVLALFTVLAILPIGVLADAWADVSVGKEGDRSKITLTLDAGTLADILQKDGISPDLLNQLKAGVAVDVEELKSVFTIEELFEIVPRDEWLRVFDIKEIMQELDAEQLLGYIDSLPDLLNEVMSNEEKAAKLEVLLKETKGIESCIDALVLLQNGYLTPKDPTMSQEDLIMNRISKENRTALINLIRKDPAKFNQLISDLEAKLANFDLDGLRNLLDVDALLENNEISLDSVVDTDKAADKIEELIKANKIQLEDIVDTAKVTEKVKELINNPNSGVKLEDIVDTDAVTAKVKELVNDPNSGVKLEDIVDTDAVIAKVKELVNDPNSGVKLEDIVDTDAVTAKVKELVNDSNSGVKLEDIVDTDALTAKVKELVNDSSSGVKLEDIVDTDALTAKVKELVNNPSSGVTLESIVDVSKIKEQITAPGSTINASELVYIDVAASRLGALVASSATLVDEIAANVYEDDVIAYLEANFEPEEIEEYVTLDGSTIVAVDAAGIVQAGILSVNTLVENDLVDEAALADIAVNNLTSLDGLFNMEKAKELLNIEDIVDTEAAEALVGDKIAYEDVIDTEAAEALVGDKIAYEDVIDADAAEALIGDKIAYEDVINTEKAEDLIGDKIAYEDVINTEKAEDLIGDKIAYEDVIDTEAAKNLIGDKIAYEDVIITKKVKELVENGDIALEEVLDVEAAKDALLALDNDVLMEYVDPIEAFRLIGLDKAISLVGGYDVAKNYIDINGLINDIDLVATLKKIPSNQLNSVVDMKKLFGMLDLNALIDIVGFDTIFAQIDNNELMEIAQQINIREKIRPVLSMVFDQLLLNVDGLSLNAHRIAAEGKDGLLTINAEELVAAVREILPSLHDLANLEDGKLVSFDLDIKYAVAGTAPNTERKTKKLTIEFVVNGNFQLVKDAAVALKNKISPYINKMEVSTSGVIVDVNAPELITRLYAQILDYDRLSDDLKQKIMFLTDLDGEKTIAFVESRLTYGDLAELFGAIEPNKLYDKLVSIAYVEAAMQKVDAKLGSNLSEMSMDDLLVIALNSNTSIEGIAGKVEEMTGRNVAALIDSLAIKVDGFADKVEELAVIEKILNKIESKLNINLDRDFATEILNRAEGVDLVDAIVSKVSAKVGKDVVTVLDEIGTDVLYELALEKAANYADEYDKVFNFTIAKLEMLPDELLNRSLTNAYEGNGVLHEGVSFSYNPKPFVEKVLGKIMNVVNNSAVQPVIDMIMARVSDGTRTMTFDATVRLKNIYRITYRSRDDLNNKGTPLFTALVPVGTDLEIVSSGIKNLAGYEFSGWATIDGKQITKMPAADITVYADFHSVKLTFADEQGNVLGAVMVPKNVALNSEGNKYLNLIKDVENTLTYPGATTVSSGASPVWTWADGKLDLEKGIGLDTTFTTDTTLTISWRQNYYFRLFGDFEYTVEDFDGRIVVTVYGDPRSQPFMFDFIYFVIGAVEGRVIDLTVKIVNGEQRYDFLYFSNENLKSLYVPDANDTIFYYNYHGSTVLDSFKDSYYDGVEGVDFQKFEITVDGNKKDFDPNAPILITLPFDPAKTNSEATTNVYTVDADGQRDRMPTSVTKDGFVSFEAVHFSDFVFANEYVLDVTFEDEEGFSVPGTLAGFALGEVVYIPAGATVDFKFDGITSYTVLDAWLNNLSLKDISTGAFPETIVMPAANTTLDVLLQGATYNIYYIYNNNGTLTVIDTYQYRLSEIDRDTFELPALAANLMATVEAAAPAGYSKAAGSVKWSTIDNNDLGTADIYVFAQWTPIEYTVKFVDAQNNPIGTPLTEVTIEKYPTSDKLPLPALLEGMTKWTISSIGAPDASNVVTIVLAAVYSDVKYPIVAGEGVVIGDNKTEAAAGEEITVSATQKNGHTAIITVKTPTGHNISVADGKFTMPASSVIVSVNYVVNTYTYTIVNGTAGTSTTGTGLFGDTVTFTVTVDQNSKHKLDSDAYTLISIALDGGKRVYTYAFVLDGDKTVTYTLEELSASMINVFKIFNGMLFTGEGDPVSENENVKFNGWSAAILGSLRFATFSLIDSSASLLWLWILLGVLLLIAIIVLLYTLHIKGKWNKPMFLVRFVVWIVSLFFALCLAIAALGLKIAGLFGKKEDPTEYFVEDEASEETAEEVAAENASEDAAKEAVVVDDLAKEVAIEVAVEIAKEVAKEVAQKVAEKVADEVAPEAEEAVVEEAVAEEAVAEEAVAEEVAEEAAEEVVEEAAEEVAEEAAEEVAEEAAEEVVEEAAEEVVEEASRRPSGLRKTILMANSLAHRTTWLRSDLLRKWLKRLPKKWLKRLLKK